jgi:hypothetical protein
MYVLTSETDHIHVEAHDASLPQQLHLLQYCS